MFKRFSTNYLVLLFLLDNLLVCSALWLATSVQFAPAGFTFAGISLQYSELPQAQLYLSIALLWSAIFLICSCYTPRRVIFWFDEFRLVLGAHTVAALSLAGLLYLSNIALPRSMYIAFYVLAVAGLIGYRVALRIWYRSQQDATDNVARILIAGAGDVGQNLVAEFKHQQWPGIQIIGFIDDNDETFGAIYHDVSVLGNLDSIQDLVYDHRIDEVIIALPRDAHDRVGYLVSELREFPVHLRVVPDYFDLAFHGASIERLGNYPLIGLRDPAIDGFQRFVKRLVDIAISAVGLLLASPILGLIALLIKLEDQGPIFYRSPRAGENGRTFEMLKFRSMVVNADKIQDEVNHIDDETGIITHKVKSDPRVTKIGKFIRRTSLDELPQLWNVLIGEMSIVGPRPELPWLVDAYEPWQRTRFAVPQGITGWWQVNGRSDNLMHLNTDQDLYYVQNYSIWLDIQILWRTVGVVLKGKGAY